MWKEGVRGPTRGNPYSLGERLYRGYREESYPFFKSYIGGWVMVFMCVKECVIFRSGTAIVIS